MKIFIALDTFFGGAGNIAAIIAEYYSKQNQNEVFIFLRSPKHHQKKGKKFESIYDLSKVKIFGDKDFLGFRTLHKEIIYLNKLIHSINPDIIIAFLSAVGPQILLSQWFTKVPVIVSERSNPFHDTPSFYYKILRNFSYRRANLITVLFDSFKLFNKPAFEKNKIKVIPNMILTSKFSKDYSKLSNKISFVTCASLFKVKQIDLMIKLFSLIHNTFPNTELNIYGQGIEETKLKKLVKDMALTNDIHFKGHVFNIKECLVLNDIYLMTSKHEGFPNALSEALSVGLPSISLKCHDGLSELIQNGENGYLINERDHFKFVEIAKTLINNHSLRKLIGEKAKQSIKKYEYNRIMTMWNKHIYSLINK